MNRIYRQFVMLVPAHLEPTTEAERAVLPDKVMPAVEQWVTALALAESRLPRLRFSCEIVVTDDLDRIDALPLAPNCAEQDGCTECRAGRDWAKTYLMENPGRHVIVGLATVTALPPL